MPQVRDAAYQLVFDLTQDNPEVNESEEIDQILGKFELVTLKELDDTYKRNTGISDPEYAKMHSSNTTFYLVDPKMIYQNIAGDIRIKDLLSRDEFYSASIMDRSQPINWRIDKRILYKILELREELEKKDYNKYGFFIRNGYRTPEHNKAVGGAPKSRHIKGDAVDMTIDDINGDGQYTDTDKQIVIDILEKIVIKDQGGIGKYPGTRSVHMDVRGYKARWDSY